jgi:nucleotide-binding universal stress UspA family protein
MFENVLVGIDGTSNGRDAIALAAQLVARDGRLTLANVRNDELHPLYAVVPGARSDESGSSLELLERERSDAQVQAEVVSVAAEDPGAGLHRQAEAQGADLLVVGSCGRGTFGRVMLGDDTRAALNGAPCAVAIAARGRAGYPTPIAKVGVAYNGSPESRGALAKAVEVARPTHASVTALEVVTIPSYLLSGLSAAAVGQSVELMLTEARARMGELEGAEGRVVYGLPGEELAAFGEEVDLLVVGSRGYGPVRRLVLGSTSDFLERHARCSLLVLPRAAGPGAA